VQQVLEALGSDAWRLTPATFASRISKGKWLPAAHLQYISSLISYHIIKGNGRLVVNIPPRHGKSELLSVYTPSWFLDRFPDKSIILSSYGASLAEGFGRRVRDIIRSNPNDLRCELATERVDEFHTTAGGSFYAVGVAGATTGRGADLLLIDDYLKNAKDAASEGIRNDIWDWFGSTSYTRLEPDGTVIILATRWNLDDLNGRIERLPGDDWTYINLPAFAVEDDPLGREIGEALWPFRYDMPTLKKIETVLGKYFWQALYQQRPIPRSAGQVDASMFQIPDIMPDASRMRKVRAWDFAGTEEKGDWTVGVLMGEDMITDRFYILDVVRVRIAASELESIVRATAMMDGSDTRITLEQEPGSSGKFMVEHMVNNVLKGYDAEGLRASGEKFVRAQPLIAQIQALRVYMPRALWNSILIDEFCLFPDAPHDDQVDAASQAYQKLTEKRYGGVVWGRVSNAPSKAATSGLRARGKEMSKTSGKSNRVTWGRGKA